MGTKRAKVGHLAPGASNVLYPAIAGYSWLYPAIAGYSWLYPAIAGYSQIWADTLHGRTRFAKVGPPRGRDQIC